MYAFPLPQVLTIMRNSPDIVGVAPNLRRIAFSEWIPKVSFLPSLSGQGMISTRSPGNDPASPSSDQTSMHLHVCFPDIRTETSLLAQIERGA